MQTSENYKNGQNWAEMNFVIITKTSFYKIYENLGDRKTMNAVLLPMIDKTNGLKSYELLLECLLLQLNIFQKYFSYLVFSHQNHLSNNISKDYYSSTNLPGERFARSFSSHS